MRGLFRVDPVCRMKSPRVSFTHLAHLSTADGLYEHAEFATPRVGHGYCVDDVGRGLVVTSRQPDATPEVRALEQTYLDFVLDALTSSGLAHNRRNMDGNWVDDARAGDHWGRALWGLGTAAWRSGDDRTRARALAGARVAAQARSPHPLAMAHAAVGAAEMLHADPSDAEALSLMHDARDIIGRPTGDPQWPWPRPRLGYANALIPEALMAIGWGLDDSTAVSDGLELLGWLAEMETSGDHLSVTPAGGWGAGEARPGFDQQPIEVSSLAEAAFRAWELTGHANWAFLLDRCASWFLGGNDVGLAMCDPETGGGYDGLLPDCVNLNQGAESTIAAISTFQLANAAAFAGVL